MEKKYSVSICVATYNQDFEKIKRTLKSIILQKDVDVEIVVCDDGSDPKFNYENKLNNYFKENNFSNYQLVLNKKNRGTVRNLYSGLVKSKAKYVKGLGPGDYLSDPYALSEWVKCAIEHDVDMSFCDVICYTGEESITPIKVRAMPENVRVYKKNNPDRKKNILKSFLLTGDHIHGAVTLIKTDIMLHYLEKLLDKVIYCEDLAYRMMIVDRIEIEYFPRICVFYEYGVGVSHNKSSVWMERLRHDNMEFDKLLYEYEWNTRMKKTYFRIKRSAKSKVKMVIIKIINMPELNVLRLERKFRKRYTSTVLPDNCFLYKDLV